MNTKSLLVYFTLIVMFLSACASISTPVAEVATVPSEAESVAEADEVDLYPLSTRTGITDVDVVLAAIESGDPQQFRDLMKFVTVACTNADGLGGPPKCREEEAEGTLVDVFLFLGGEGSYLHKDNLDLWTGMDVTRLYAIYRNSEYVYSDDEFPAGEYAMLFLSENEFPGTILQLTGGQIIRIDTVFDTSAAGLADILKRDALEMILPPK